ncbi:DNA/RNA-binding domain E.t1.c1-type [Penicillium chermesinum]|nr:DNA/RNA-binding domain E.t1.c1-type [Penicillium chermesinum]
MNESSSKAPFRHQRSDEASTATTLVDRDAIQMTMLMEVSTSAQILTYPQASDTYSGHERTTLASDQAIHELPEASEPPPTLFKQPVTSPISEEQLINEQIESRAELSESQWQDLISLHRKLLYEHHDFFLASQHPSASPVLKRLAEKYAMPARMWRYGIHSFLELLRQNLPASLEYMLNFIHVAYSMMTLLYESARALQEAWIECLGDLARYRMAVEESDMRDREIWAGVSRYWYKQGADRSPDIGRIQHHLAVLARPDGLLQLFYYTKSLICVRPFQNARESIVLLFNPYKEQPLGQKTITTSFITTHGILFTQDPDKKFVDSANNFLALLRKNYHGLGRQGQQGVYITCCNIASILQYGKPDAIMEVEFSQKPGDTAEAAHKFAKEWMSTSKSGMMDLDAGAMEVMPPHIPSQIAAQGSALTFQTLSIFLDQVQDPNSYPGIHVGLAFIWCLALHPTAMQQLEKMIPRAKIAHFLNILLIKEEGGINYSIIECQSFPSMEEEEEEMVKYLAEDFSIRGNVWSQLYYEPDFFQDAPQEDERPAIETEKATFTRIHRCLWLGNRIATVWTLP